MACSKYTLTNTGSSIVNFSYQRCDDAMWEYQVELNPGQTKTIWLLNSTYSTAFSTNIVEVDLGAFPPVALSPTPTISVTPSNTPTISVTPSNTPTISLTPSVTASSTPTNTPTQTLTNTITNTQTGTPNQTPTQTPTQTQTGTPNVTPTTTTTQTQTGTPNETPTPSVTTTNTETPTNTPTPSITASQTPTLTNTPTVTQSGTPDVTPTPTPTPFGTNTFKVSILPIRHNITLTEIPYIGTSGVGFTGTTGTYPLSAGTTNFGTHQAISGDTVSFEITTDGGPQISIEYYKNGSYVQGFDTSISAGATTVNIFIGGAASALSTDDVEFQIY